MTTTLPLAPKLPRKTSGTFWPEVKMRNEHPAAAPYAAMVQWVQIGDRIRYTVTCPSRIRLDGPDDMAAEMDDESRERVERGIRERRGIDIG